MGWHHFPLTVLWDSRSRLVRRNDRGQMAPIGVLLVRQGHDAPQHRRIPKHPSLSDE